ncbi:MAG TPA: hypothetical protein EYF95_00255 [Flavobacteriales bacterium]|nr:hypothetical protein [Flavobacteriales bacterium]
MTDHLMFTITTPENLLHLALYAAVNIEDENNSVRLVADELILGYIIHDFSKDKTKEYTEKDMQEKYHSMCLDFTLTRMEQEGLIEVDLSGEEASYKLTSKGKKYLSTMPTTMPFFKRDDSDD